MKRGNYRKRPTWLPWLIKQLVWGGIFALLTGIVVMMLWNAILPQTTGAKPLTFLQAIGILILSRLLFYGGIRTPKQMKNNFTTSQRNNKLPEEDRAAFLARIRQRLSEVERSDPPSLR